MSDLNQLVEQVKQATDYQINKRILREKIQTDLHFVYNSGLFKASPELFAFVSSWADEELFLEDTYQNPIKVSRREFLDLCSRHYNAVMNTWHIEHERLKQIRKI